MATMTPVRWTARPRGASLPSAKCVRTHCSRPHTKKEFAAGAPRRRSAPGPRTRDVRCQSSAPHTDPLASSRIFVGSFPTSSVAKKSLSCASENPVDLLQLFGVRRSFGVEVARTAPRACGERPGVIPCSNLPQTSNKIIQKGLAFGRKQSGSATVPGA